MFDDKSVPTRIEIMWRYWAQTFVIVLAVTLSGHPAGTQTGNLSVPNKELVVATKEAPPFAMKRLDGSWHGISIDLWRHIADRLHLRYRFVERPTVQELIVGTAEGPFDAAIAALTVTAARERVLTFTHPFYTTGLGIAVPRSEGRWMQIFNALSSFGFFQAVLTLLAIAVCVGCVIWLLERRKTEHFGGGVKGLGSGVWWSAIAMTQAGAAQGAPMTLAGRVVATGWMIASVIAIAVFTAGITSALTKRDLQGSVQTVNDLRSVRVGAVSGSSTGGYLDHQRISHRGFANAQVGLKALQTGAVDAFVYDKPLLTWIVLQEFPNLRVLDVTFDNQNYAIALPKDSALREMLNVALLEETESEWWQQTLFQYLGKRQAR